MALAVLILVVFLIFGGIKFVRRENIKKELRVFIVDNLPIVRQGLKQLIGQQTDLMVCGEANNFFDVADKIL